jgi:hypothetical protein
MKLALLMAAQLHPPVAETVTLPEPPAAANEPADDERLYEQPVLGQKGPGHSQHDTPPCDEHVPEAVCEQE